MTVLHHKRERCSWLHVCPTLMYTGFEAEPHTDIFVTLCWSHTINRFSRLPSVALLFTGFRAIPVPVTGDDPRPKFRCYSQTAVVYRLPSTATSIRTY